MILGFESLVAIRFLREGRMQTLLIIVGVAAGVAVVAYISALITGLQRNTIEKTLGAQAHVTVSAPDERVQVVPTLPGTGVSRLEQTQARAQRPRRQCVIGRLGRDQSGHARQRVGRLHQLAVQSHLVDLFADREEQRLRHGGIAHVEVEQKTHARAGPGRPHHVAIQTLVPRPHRDGIRQTAAVRVQHAIIDLVALVHGHRARRSLDGMHHHPEQALPRQQHGNGLEHPQTDAPNRRCGSAHGEKGSIMVPAA